MALVVKERPEPPTWAHFRHRIRRRWLTPLHAIDWFCEQTAWRLSRWAFLEVLEYVGSLSILVAVIFYFADAGERRQQRHYQAWQVINTAQGKGGNGGRISALQQLNEDRVSLVGVDVSEAFLQGVELEKAELRRANFQSCDLRSARLRSARLPDATLDHANLRGADLTRADLEGASAADADFTAASLADANLARLDLGQAELQSVDLTGADLRGADLRGADLAGIRNWRSIRGIERANLFGVRAAPEGFVAWALAHGAVQIESDADWRAARQKGAEPSH